MLTTNQILHKGRYRVINSFSHDETGRMYEAYDTVSDTNVVLRESIGKLGKVTTSTQLEAMNAAFAGGAKVLTEINHESLVSVQDYFSEIDHQYLVLEAVTGVDLTKFLQAGESRPTLSEVLSWADQLLNALNYLHQLLPPVIHRDIRPENIKLTSSQNVKLLTAAAAVDTASRSFVSTPGQTIGNTAIHYRPLEQIWDGLDQTSQRVILKSYDEASENVLVQPLDARSDLYSLAASLYHVLTGTLPCDALDRSIAILDGKADPLQRPCDLDASIPAEISDVLVKAMSIRREHRFDAAVLMQQVLRTAVIRVEERGAENLKAAIDARSETPVETDIESIEAQLELEKIKADERQREIEVEQLRLEEEQQRLQQRRLELEAERKRLELEAELERRQAAQRLEELDAEREFHRAEQERIETDTNKEQERYEQRMKELSVPPDSSESSANENDDDQILLELDHTQKPVSTEAFDLLDDELLNEPNSERSAEVADVVTASPYAETTDLTENIGYAPSSFNWRVPAIAAAVLILLIVVVGAWKFISTGATASVSTEQTTAQSDRATQTSATDVQAVSDLERPIETDASEVPTSSSNQTPAIDDGLKRVQLTAQLDKVKKPAAAPAKTPPPKKKVTVDDLINDN